MDARIGTVDWALDQQTYQRTSELDRWPAGLSLRGYGLAFISVAAALVSTLFLKHLFPHPLMGRQLVHLFRSAGATNYSAGAVLGMDHDQGFYKRWFRMTA